MIRTGGEDDMTRALDAEVASRLMGIEVIWLLPDADGVQHPCLAAGAELEHGITRHDRIKSYSSDISAVVGVVEQLARAGWKIDLGTD